MVLGTSKREQAKASNRSSVKTCLAACTIASAGGIGVMAALESVQYAYEYPNYLLLTLGGALGGALMGVIIGLFLILKMKSKACPSCTLI